MINFKKIFPSLKSASRGIKEVFLKENNLRIHFLVGIIVIIFLFILPLKDLERLILIFIVFFVIILEIINSSIEKILDLIKKEHNENVRDIKDISASFVLLGSILAIILAVLIFKNYFGK